MTSAFDPQDPPNRGAPDPPPREEVATVDMASRRAMPPDSLTRQILRSPRVLIGGGVLLLIAITCLVALPWTLFVERSDLYYDNAFIGGINGEPEVSLAGMMGYDADGRSVLGRSLLGGVISLAVGIAAASISVFLGVSVGLIAGYAGGKVDAALMRTVDIIYGLPYILLVILFKVGLERPTEQIFVNLGFERPAMAASLTVMFLAIGLVSWLTMARVVRGQVLSLRAQPFIEAARAGGIGPVRVFWRHLLPNLVGPILVYATLIIPQAILQESFLSFLGIGVVPPLPSWGSLANAGLRPAFDPFNSAWWQLLFPCLLLAVTLLSLNFLGDGLRDLFDPKRGGGNI
jgi:oligopeptide transport system permease protein